MSAIHQRELSVPPTGETSSTKALGLKKLGANISGMLLSQAASTLLALAQSILIARALGPTGNGIYTLAVLLPTLLSTLLNLGIATANSYYLASGAVSARAALRASTVLSAFLSLFGCIVGIPLIVFYSPQLFNGVDKPYLFWMLVVFPIALIQMSQVSVLLGLQKFRPYNIVNVATSVLNTALAAFLLYALRWNVVGALTAYAATQVFGLLLTLYYLAPYVPSVEGYRKEAKAYAPKCISYGYKAHLGNIVAFLNYRIDVFLVGFYLGPGPVGIYALAVLMAERLWILSYAASSVILPRISELNKDADVQKQVTPIVGRWVLFATVGISVLVVLFGHPLLLLMYGPKFIYAYTVMLWLLPGVILISLSRVLGNDIAARGRVDINLYSAIAVMVVNLVACVILIPRYGLIGGALSTSIGYFADCVLRVVVYARLSENHWYASLIPHRSDLSLASEVMKSLKGRLAQ